jgi:ATP-binding cassette subfamily F protein uup
MALRAERSAYRQRTGNVRLAIDGAAPAGKVVFEADRINKAFAGMPVIRDFSVRVLRTDRIGLIGPNGSGKTTLLRLLLGELEPDSGTVRHGSRIQVAYFDQQRAQLDPAATVADSVMDGNTTIIVNGQPRHVVGYLADFLFPRERAMSPVRSLSGGERNRLLLARLFARPANVLVLDEPTNDLDIETLELLEELIADFDGTVLLVTHDRVFLDRIVTSTLAFEGEGRVVDYVGGWTDYLRQQPEDFRGRRAGSPIPETGAPGAVPRTPSPQSRVPAADADPAARRKLSYREQRELESLPAHIAALETEQERLRRDSESPQFYKESAAHINGVLARLDSLGPELERALARWVELEDRA